ncbi:MAG: aldo/keto reductase [Planctomycetaceae bacterium]|nr:aldo/keto reductase [Planctomycetaceae bacterium]
MHYRKFGRTGWQVSEIGYGMWGMGGQWIDSDDAESLRSLELSIELGCNFFDTALAYGSERLLAKILRRHRDKDLYVATKIPPKDQQWPSQRAARLMDVFPPEYIRRMTEKSLKNLKRDCLDLQQFHVWEDAWANDERWQRAVEDLKRAGLVRAIGVSVNRWEPWNVLSTLRTGLVDAVQVIYNVFEQAPDDELFPLCQERDLAVIARVPLDEGTLTGKLTKRSRWPDRDWRSSYFVPENLKPSVERANRLKPLVPTDRTMAQMALGFILANSAVSTTIPGMRKEANVRDNIAACDMKLSKKLLRELKRHRWDRSPTEWSQ